MVLGRGSVKAGIDFGTFDENNFRYDVEKKTIHLIGMKPQILTSDINPWFIPEKKVKGFEIIVMNKKAARPEYMLKVKQMALKKLKQNAIQAGIVKQAKKNAENALKSFFTLLIPEGVDEVIIHDSYLSYFDQSFVSDSITTDVMRSIDSLFVSRFKTDSIEIVNLRKSLDKRKIYLQNGTAVDINRFSANLRIVEDDVLTDRETRDLEDELSAIEQQMVALQDTSISWDDLNKQSIPDRLDSVWFFPSKAQVDTYRKEVKETYQDKDLKWHQVISRHPDFVKNERLMDRQLERKVRLYLLQERLYAFKQFYTVVMGNVSHLVRGDITYSIDTTASVKPIEGTDHEVHYVKDFNDKLVGIDEEITEALIQDSIYISLEDIWDANQEVNEQWTVNQNAAERILFKMRNNWRFVYGEDTMRVNRYSEWYSYLKGDTLLSGFDDMYNALDSADSVAMVYLTETKPQDMTMTRVKAANQALDVAWFYPSKEELDKFTEQVNRKKYRRSLRGIQSQLRLIEMESKIQRHVLRQKASLQEAMKTEIKSKAKVVKRENGSNPTTASTP